MGDAGLRPGVTRQLTQGEHSTLKSGQRGATGLLLERWSRRSMLHHCTLPHCYKRRCFCNLCIVVTARHAVRKAVTRRGYCFINYGSEDSVLICSYAQTFIIWLN